MEPPRRRRTICCQGLLLLGMLAVCQTAQQQAAASAPAAADSTLADTLDADADELDFTNTTTVVQTDLPIITFGNEWNPVTLTASVISADYNRTHVAPTSGLVMFMLSGEHLLLLSCLTSRMPLSCTSVTSNQCSLQVVALLNIRCDKPALVALQYVDDRGCNCCMQVAALTASSRTKASLGCRPWYPATRPASPKPRCRSRRAMAAS